MDYKITESSKWGVDAIMVTDDVIGKESAEIDAALGAQYNVGTIIYTAGYAKIKQKGLDGAWVEVVTA